MLKSKKEQLTYDRMSGMGNCRDQHSAYRTVGISCIRYSGKHHSFCCGIFCFSVFYFWKAGKKAYTENTDIQGRKKQFFLKFFDVKSFVIMAVMMTGGIYIRESGLGPEIFIAVFYSGLGASLLLAGILFGRNYFREISLQKKTAQRCC